MKRKIYDKLLEWKSRNGASGLLVKGARRVGKSYIVEEFARNEYRSYIKNAPRLAPPSNIWWATGATITSKPVPSFP